MGRTKLHEIQAQLRETKAELEATKLARDGCRVKYSDSLPMGDHITILSVGHTFDAVYLHTNLIPRQTQTWIASHGLVGGLVYPILDESPDMVRRYRAFLYTGKVASKDEDLVDDTSGDSEWHQLVLMHIFSTKVRDEKFGNKVLDALVEKVQEENRWPTDLAHDVYNETKAGDPLRKLYVDLHVWVGQGEGIKFPYEDRDGPAQFIRDVRMGLAAAGKRVSDPEAEVPWQSICKHYHKHEMTPVCGMEQVEVIDLTAD